MNQQEIDRLWQKYHGYANNLASCEKPCVDEAQFISAIQEATAQARREALCWPDEMTPALREVLGKPNFWCARLAEVLRRKGQEIRHKAEDEQAAVLFWLAGLALKHGDGWKDATKAEIEAIRALAAQEPEAVK